ncbi:hypothetical protein AB1Y20_000346 [Prymnesium parvum]|uniref:IBR domain-containing protein n=1 Tax=Prymnesium parvum TaxID=97485 RepID=A0AB34K946_PRYPA
MSSRKRAVSPQPPAPSRNDSSCSSTSFGYSDTEEETIVRKESPERTSYSEAQVREEWELRVNQVTDTLPIGPSQARWLLSRTRPPWDVEKVCEAWFDNQKCSQLPGKQHHVQNDASASCLACETLQGEEVAFPLSCGHLVCAECLPNFLGHQLDQRSFPPYTCEQISGYSCDGVLDVDVADLPLDEAQRALILRNETTLESEVKPFRKCPNGACDKMNRPLTGQVNLRCECGAHYCFACGQEAHFPMPCKYARMWLTNFIMPITDAMDAYESDRERDRQVMHHLQRATDSLHPREHRREGRPCDHLCYWRHVVPKFLNRARSSPPPGSEFEDERERLRQLTAAELLAEVPTAVRRTLEVLGLAEAEAAELALMAQPNNVEAAVQHEAGGATEEDHIVAAGIGEAALVGEVTPMELVAEVVGPLEPVQAAPLEPPAPVHLAAPPEPPDLAQAAIPDPAQPDLAVGAQHHKLCPGCLLPAKLEGLGCNSTVCPNCSTPFCYICLRTECEVVRSHGVCPQGGIDVAAFLAAALSRSAAAATAAAADIASLASYQPDAQEMARLNQTQHDRLNNLREAFHWRRPATSPLDALVRALTRIGVSMRAGRPRDVDDLLRAQGQVEREQATRVAALFVATNLNLSHLDLLPELERARIAWDGIQKSLDAIASIEVVLSDDFFEVLRTTREALRLQQWLLADDWISSTGRVRSQAVPMIDVLRNELGDHVLSLSIELHKVAKERVEGSSSDVTTSPRVWDLYHPLKADLHDLLEQLHAVVGAGAAMNNR